MHRCLFFYAVIILVAASIAGGCTSPGPRPGGTGEKLDPSLQVKVKELDDEVDKEIREGEAVEAREWLKGGNHSFWNESSIKISDIVERYYAAGAKKVYITGIGEMEGSYMSASIAVEMPADKDARVKVLEADRVLAGELGDEPEKEVSQKYLQRSFD